MIQKFQEFVNENKLDRAKIKSKLFYLSNSHNNRIEFKPYNTNIVDKFFIFSNSVAFYKNGVPVDELRNINTESNDELRQSIEDRIKILSK